MKEKSKEMADNQGDLAGAYQKQRNTEKEKAIQVREYRGALDYEILKERKKIIKEKQAEIRENTGDIIYNYVKNRERLKESNHRIDNYSGKINYDELKKAKDKMIALDKVIHSYTGDILTSSLEKKKATLRDKSRRATWYEGDMIVTRRLKSKHPSAVYIAARSSKSIEQKERIRKRALKNARKHREREDPNYLRGKTPSRPRYDDRTNEIWDFDSRTGEGIPVPTPRPNGSPYRNHGGNNPIPIEKVGDTTEEDNGQK
jgi:hypothetical protein